MDRGFFGPDSVTWRLTRERAMLLGGPRALLLQLAHPLVAAGVADHSRFQSDPLARLRSTLDATLRIVFGTQAQAREAAERVNRVHGFVNGTLREPVGRFPAGTPYDARDPSLLLWVHATLIDTTLEVYPRFVAPLSPREMERAYEESKIGARLLLVPDEVLPPTLDAFRAWMRDTIASDAIAVGAFQRELAREVLWPRLRGVPLRAFDPMAALTIHLLPEKVRDGYGFTAAGWASRLASWAPAMTHAALAVLPSVLRLAPQARLAARRGAGRV